MHHERRRGARLKEGLYFVFEGIDGCGKSTQIRKLTAYLKALEPYPLVSSFREPGSTPIAEQVRKFLLDPPRLHPQPRSVRTGVGEEAVGTVAVEETDPVASLLGFNLARRQTLRYQLRPMLDRGEVVLADRSYLSTLAYQGYGGGLDIKLVRDLCAAVVDGYVPDRIFLLDLPTGEYFDTVRRGYLAEARRSPELIKIIDAMASIEEIFAAVFMEVQPLVRAQPVRAA
jgi:dTMP kinase